MVPEQQVIQSVSSSTGELVKTISQVMEIGDSTVDWEGYVLRVRGRLTMESERAYMQLEKQMGPMGFTPLFRREGNEHIVLVRSDALEPSASKPVTNVILFILTFLSVLYVGSQHSPIYQAPVGEGVGLTVWSIIVQLGRGLPFAGSVMGILLAHEFGHYFAARWHGAPVSLPYFIPFPNLIGTMGAVIRMKAPIKNRRALLDIGVAGPLAGLVLAMPLVIIGLELSEISVLPPGGYMLEGNSILYLLAKLIVHGEFLPKPVGYGGVSPVLYWVVFFFTGQPTPVGGIDVMMHPVAFGAWVGLLVTGINLIPAGQLDGGHVLYVLIGKNVRKWQPLVIGGLVLLGLSSPVWWIYAVLIYVLGGQRAELLDEITELDGRRKTVALGTLCLFFLLIVPIPLQIFY